jgi:SUMO ligase MMS21 Smc5/6 complex component
LGLSTNDGFQNRYLKNLQFLTVNYLCNSEAPAAVTFLLLVKVKEVELIYGQKSLLKKKEEEEDNHFNNNNSNPFTKGGEDKQHPKIK